MSGAEPVDFDGCAREPIHIIGLTQSYGLLIAVSEPDLVVRYVSANAREILGTPAGELIGAPLDRGLGAGETRRLQMFLETDDLVRQGPLRLSVGRPGRDYRCLAHRNGAMLLLEFEPLFETRSLEPINSVTRLQEPIARMEREGTLDGVACIAAAEVARAAGYDRVMIYQFDRDWNGRVIAETGVLDRSFLGHQFPAADIPAQARQLFRINTLRAIVDVASDPVPIVSSADAIPLDLSRSLLRSASAIHIAYLRNMGVAATLTVSIIVRGELWGMITAHHRTAHHVDYVSRSVCAVIGQILALRITALADNELLQQRLRSRELTQAYGARSERSGSLLRGGALDLLPLLELMDVDGAISVVDGFVSVCGVTVNQHQLAPVVACLRDAAAGGIASSSRLSELDGGARSYAARVSGALYIGLSEGSDDYILLLRSEQIQMIVWAGNPAKLSDPQTARLSPRASFASWSETVRASSRPWTDLQLETSHLLREQFANARLRHRLGERDALYQQERARATLFQQAVLPPQLPQVPGLSFDAVYESGRMNEQVGGDWYDAVRLIDGRVLITIGDVAGSGVHAAVVMGVVRQIMRGIAQVHPEPALMLDAADRALRLEFPDVFVTAWVGVIDLVARSLTYASAGHPPPLLKEPNGQLRELDHRTLPIGLRQGHEGHTSTVTITHGSLLCLHTDGLIEATHDILEGIRRLKRTLATREISEIARPAAAIRRRVIPDGSSDDVAILVVKMNLDESEHFLSRSQFDSSDAFAARGARRAFAAALPHAEFSANDIANAEIVFGELCGNVARYAPGLMNVIVDRSGTQTVLHVLDRGVGFRHLSRLPSDVFAESGRGLFIIASMTSEFTVTQRADGGSHARAVLVGRYPQSLLRDETLTAGTDRVAAGF